LAKLTRKHLARKRGQTQQSKKGSVKKSVPWEQVNGKNVSGSKQEKNTELRLGSTKKLTPSWEDYVITAPYHVSSGGGSCGPSNKSSQGKPVKHGENGDLSLGGDTTHRRGGATRTKRRPHGFCGATITSKTFSGHIIKRWGKKKGLGKRTDAAISNKKGNNNPERIIYAKEQWPVACFGQERRVPAEVQGKKKKSNQLEVQKGVGRRIENGPG